MYGNGWPGSTASGVSTGKISSKKRCPQLEVALRPLVVADDADLLLGQLVANRGERLGVAGDHRQQARPDGVECLRRAHAVGRRARPARLDLLLQAGDADLEELVEVAGEDGQEANALEQRVALVDSLEQDAVIELEPRQLAVDVRDLRRSRRAACSGGTRLARRSGSRRDQLITRRTNGGHGVAQFTTGGASRASSGRRARRGRHVLSPVARCLRGTGIPRAAAGT